MNDFFRYLTFVALLAVLGFGLYWVKEFRNKTNALNSMLASLAECSTEMKRTLLSGLISRFSYTNTETDETPLDFDRFVAKIFRMYYGGKTSVTRTSSDFGVAIEHRRSGKLHLGQVKCCAQENKVGFEPIAIIHSQMVKQGAAGGFVVTTSDFSANAKAYAENLGIELINGTTLTEMWAATLKAEKLKSREEMEPQQA